MTPPASEPAKLFPCEGRDSDGVAAGSRPTSPARCGSRACSGAASRTA